MKNRTKEIFQRYCKKYDFINFLQYDLLKAYECLLDSYQNNGKLLVCGNGGSNADADHIVGELLKGFLRKRPLNETQKELLESYGEEASALAGKLQGSLPAINLGTHTSLITAVANDIGGDEIFAQQVNGFGMSGDTFMGISTSGNSKNVLYAGFVAKSKGLKTLALTGRKGGKIAENFDVAIRVPSDCTPDIQDMHTSVYHALCAMIESEFWDE